MALLTVLVWALYPLVWILGVGIGAIGVSLENICYAILDPLSKVVFCFLMINVYPYDSVPVGQSMEQGNSYDVYEKELV